MIATHDVDQRQPLLAQWASAIDRAALVGALSSDKPISVKRIEYIAGLRAGALEIDAGFDTGRLLRALPADDMTLARQFVPWAFVAQPAVYMLGRFVRVEAGWNDALAPKMISVRQSKRKRLIAENTARNAAIPLWRCTSTRACPGCAKSAHSIKRC